jgi:hypothetical protein
MQQAKAILADAILLKALQLLIHQAGEAFMQDITEKAVRPSSSEEHIKFRSIQADEYS